MSAARNLYRSLSLRIAIAYALIFVVSVALLLALLYWISVTRPLGDVRAQVEAESSSLAGLYMLEGVDETRAALERRADTVSDKKAFHLLLDRRGRVVTSNLPSWPARPRAGWVRIEADVYSDGDEVDHMALALDRTFPDGARLIVGRDVEQIDELSEALQRVGASVVGGTLGLALLGGLLVSATIGRRIEAMGRTARQVIAGDLSGRVPVRGTGDDFDELAVTLNLMLARIEALIESVARVSDSIAHELRTPLARLQADLDEVRNPALDDAARRAAADAAAAEASHLQSMFGALLRIARIESGRHSASFVPVDLAAILRDAAELYAPAAEERGIVVVVELPATLPISGDADLLFQVASNLLDNAIKYTPDGGRVRVRHEAGRPGVAVSVADSGPGIEPAERQRVFERFYRLPATAPLPGAGLGLPLVAAVVRYHGAEVELHESDLGGLMVELRFKAPGAE